MKSINKAKIEKLTNSKVVSKEEVKKRLRRKIDKRLIEKEKLQITCSNRSIKVPHSIVINLIIDECLDELTQEVVAEELLKNFRKLS